MDTRAEMINSCLTELIEAHAVADAKIERLLELFEGADAADRVSAELMLTTAGEIGHSGQVRDGGLIRVLAQADRVKAKRHGLAPWIAMTLDVTACRARGIAQSAREIGHLPELAEFLTSGRIGARTIRTLTRAACAMRGVDRDLTEVLIETLTTATQRGLAEANRQVRILEAAIKPECTETRPTGQRHRRFLRVLEHDGGMCHIEALLDPEGATAVRAALDANVSAIVHRRQRDRAQVLHDGKEDAEQLQAHALVKVAEFYLATTAEQRDVSLAQRALGATPLDEPERKEHADLPRDTVLPLLADPAARLVEGDDGEPDMPASREQFCTHPGCGRPPIWPLPGYSKIPHRHGGITRIENLVLPCGTHRVLARRPATPEPESAA